MKEYIDRSELIKVIGTDTAPFTTSMVFRHIRNAPAADVVEVVRCRECKRWDADPDSYGKDDGPKGRCMKSFEETDDDDFCSYGERGTENV